MNTAEKDKLKHDTLNSIVIINSMSKSASSLIHKLTECLDCHGANCNQISKLLYAMSVIREQTAKIENNFKCVLKE